MQEPCQNGYIFIFEVSTEVGFYENWWKNCNRVPLRAFYPCTADLDNLLGRGF